MRRDLGQRPAGEPGLKARGVILAFDRVRNHPFPVSRRHQAGDPPGRESCRQELQSRHLEVDFRWILERRRDLERELPAGGCVHVKIAFALSGQRTQSPGKSPVHREDFPGDGIGDAWQGVGQDRHEQKLPGVNTTGINGASLAGRVN